MLMRGLTSAGGVVALQPQQSLIHQGYVTVPNADLKHESRSFYQPTIKTDDSLASADAQETS